LLLVMPTGCGHALARSATTRAWFAAGGDAFVVQVADVLDGPVGGEPDGVRPLPRSEEASDPAN